VAIAIQAGVAMSQLRIGRADFEARSRPYLSIRSLGVRDGDGAWIGIMLEIDNLGEVPATGVKLGQVVMGGEHMAWTSRPDEDYPAHNISVGDGIRVSAGGMVVAPVYSGFPEDMLFFPGKTVSVEMPVHGATWRTTAAEGSVMDIGLSYKWRDRQYWYVATAVLTDGKWSVVMERGG